VILGGEDLFPEDHSLLAVRAIQLQLSYTYGGRPPIRHQRARHVDKEPLNTNV
jgi:hypothetical protein